MSTHVKVLAFPNAQAIPLLVMLENASASSRTYDLSLIQASSSALRASLVSASSAGASFGLFNIVDGARAFLSGDTRAQLVAVFLWGAPIILVRDDVRDDDWASLKGTTGLTTAAADTPLYALALEALRARVGSDVALATAAPEDVEESAGRFPFLVLPEPEATSFLVRHHRLRHGSPQYRRFTDMTTLHDPRGLPLGGLWHMMDGQEETSFVEDFEASISVLIDKSNLEQVSHSISRGFSQYFSFGDLPPEAALEMLSRGNIIYRFVRASAAREQIAAVWERFGITPDESIFHHPS